MDIHHLPRRPWNYRLVDENEPTRAARTTTLGYYLTNQPTNYYVLHTWEARLLPCLALPCLALPCLGGHIMGKRVVQYAHVLITFM
jgi:hypothetical protein